MIKTATFTILQHEPVFFPIWLEYYQRFFPNEDIHVLHHRLPTPRDPDEAIVKLRWEDTFNAMKEKHGFQSYPIINEASFDHEWLKQTVCQFQHQLLKEYDAVLFTEIDEIVATDPRSKYGSDLNRYIQDKLSVKDVVVCNGFEVVHKFDEEPAMDLKSPLLAQRKWWYWNKMYSKPLLSKIPLNWCWGFHACTQVPVPYRFKDDDLLLIHLHKMDYPICYDRNLSNSKRRWADGTFGFQNRITIEDRLKRWWYNDIDMTNKPAVLVEIPPEVQGII